MGLAWLPPGHVFVCVKLTLPQVVHAFPSLLKMGKVQYKIVDLFLDIWLKPDGTLLELDLDEFQDAVSRGLITEEQQTLAMTAFERLKGEVKQGLYPQKYIQTQ